jgi:hypothetical protein
MSSVRLALFASRVALASLLVVLASIGPIRADDSQATGRMTGSIEPFGTCPSAGEDLSWSVTKSVPVLGRLDYSWQYTMTGVVNCTADTPPDGSGGESKPDLWLIPASIAISPGQLSLGSGIFRTLSPDVAQISGIQTAIIASCTMAGCTGSDTGSAVIPDWVKPGTYWLWSNFGSPCESCSEGTISVADLSVIEVTPVGGSGAGAPGPVFTLAPQSPVAAPGAVSAPPPSSQDNHLFLLLLALILAGLLSLWAWRKLRPMVVADLTRGQLKALDQQAHLQADKKAEQPIGEKLLDVQKTTYEIGAKVSSAEVKEAAEGGAKAIGVVDTVHDFFEHMATNIQGTVKPLQDATKADIDKAHSPKQTVFDLMDEVKDAGSYKVPEGGQMVGEVGKDTAKAAGQTALDQAKKTIPGS